MKFTREGFLTAQVRAARTGIQEYRAAELGLKDRNPSDVIRVYRPEQEVFAKDSLRSFSMIDATIDHPGEMVDASNWRDYAVGSVGEAALRDGEFLILPLILKDQAAIKSWKDGKRELSVGYTCDLAIDAGKTPSGEAYDAVQSNIRANHLALCDAARGGPKLRIGDSEMNFKTITFDGLQVADVSPAAEAVIVKLQSQLADATKGKADAEAEVVKIKAEAVAKDAEVAKLKDDLAKAKVTPQMLRDAGKAYAATVAKAKALGVTVGDNDDEATIKRAVVNARMGDSAKNYSDEHIGIAFDTLTKDVRAEDSVDPLRQVIADGPTVATDGASVRDLARSMQYN